jgi:hypothetical protein
MDMVDRPVPLYLEDPLYLSIGTIPSPVSNEGSSLLGSKPVLKRRLVLEWAELW